MASKTTLASASTLKPKVSDAVVDEKEAKRKQMVAQMREKAAGARMQQNATSVPVSSMKKTYPTSAAPNDTVGCATLDINSIPSQVAQAKRAAVELKKPVAQKPAASEKLTAVESKKPVAQKPAASEKLKSPPPHVPAAALAPAQPPLSSSNAKATSSSSSSSASLKKAATPENRVKDRVKEQDALGALRPQLLSPMDTYEISDREDSDSESESESESEDEANSKKKVRPS